MNCAVCKSDGSFLVLGTCRDIRFPEGAIGFRLARCRSIDSCEISGEPDCKPDTIEIHDKGFRIEKAFIPHRGRRTIIRISGYEDLKWLPEYNPTRCEL